MFNYISKFIFLRLISIFFSCNHSISEPILYFLLHFWTKYCLLCEAVAVFHSLERFQNSEFFTVRKFCNFLPTGRHCFVSVYCHRFSGSCWGVFDTECVERKLFAISFYSDFVYSLCCPFFSRFGSFLHNIM